MSIFDTFLVVISILIIDHGQTRNTSELHIWGLFPSRLRNGAEFEECIDVDLLINSTQHDDILRNYTFFLHNIKSQCERDVTQDIQDFYAEPPRLLVVSGGCSPNLSRSINSDVIHISSQESDVAITVQNTFSVALWLGSGSPGLSGYLASHQISLVSVIHEDGDYYERVVFSLTEHLNYYNIETSPLLLSGHITNDVIRMETNFIRHVTLIASDDVMIDLLCQLYQRPTLPHFIFIFTNKSTCNNLRELTCNGVRDWTIQDITCFGVSTPINSLDPVNDCVFAHDAVMTTLHALNGSNPVVINSFTSASTQMRETRIELNNELRRSIRKTRFIGKTGYVAFSALGIRAANISACRLQQSGCERIFEYDFDEFFDVVVPGDRRDFDIISFREVEIELISVIYICMVACAGSMVFLAFVLLTCNIKYRSNRILKLTSPNLTIVQLLGTIVTLGAIPVLGMTNLLFIYQLSASLFSIGYTLQYGSFIVKQWRVYVIFKALQPKRKPIKDELLLLLIVGLVCVDVIILTTWWLLDPILCHQVRRLPFYQKTSDSYVIESFTTCTSELIWLWLGTIYFTKLLLMTSGIYLAYQTRHVSSPPLRDSCSITMCCYVTACLGLIILPIIGSDSIDHNVKYTLVSMVVFVTTGHAILLLVLPKILIMQEMTGSEKNRQEKLRFDSSLKLSAENSHRSMWCLCCSRDVSKKKPAYGETLLAGELETLRCALKEKETRIRELNDRLYFGSDNFRAYITNGNKRVQTIRTKVGKSHDRRATVGDVRPGQHDLDAPTGLDWERRASCVADDECEEGFGNAGFDDIPETQLEYKISNGSFDKGRCGQGVENDNSLGNGQDIENDRKNNCSPLESGIGMDDRYESDFKSCHATDKCDEAPYRSNHQPKQKRSKQLHSHDSCTKIRTVSERVVQSKNSIPMPRKDSGEIGMLQPSPVIARRNVAYAHRRLTKPPAPVYNIEGAEGSHRPRKHELGQEDYVDHKKYIQYI